VGPRPAGWQVHLVDGIARHNTPYKLMYLTASENLKRRILPIRYSLSQVMASRVVNGRLYEKVYLSTADAAEAENLAIATI
jgi:hypothetical protein